MKKQSVLFRLFGLVTLFIMSVVFAYAQTPQKDSGRKVLPNNPTNLDAKPADKQLVYAFDGKEAQSILVWLNNNPTAIMVGGPGNGGACKFEYKLLAVDITYMSDIADVPDPELKCITHLVVPKTPLEGPRAFKSKEFDGTVYDPFGPQPRAGTPPSRAASNATIALFSLDTGKLEATTTTDREGRYRFSGISEGRKAVFLRDKRGNLIYRDTLQVCGRGVNRDGKGCTDTGVPRL